MTINKYFNQVSYQPEQDLYNQLTIETIQISGMDIIYIQRDNISIDKILNEPVASVFKNCFKIEMYMQDSDTQQGDSYFMNKLGITFHEISEFYLSMTRWDQVVGSYLIRPQEGDLLYVGDPNNTYSSNINKLYQIKNVEAGHQTRAQFGANHTYRIVAEAYVPSYETFDTEYEDIDRNYNTNLNDEFINAINQHSKEEAPDTLVNKDNPFGEDYVTNKPNNPFGDIL